MANEINTWLEDIDRAIEEIFSFLTEKGTSSDFKKISRENVRLSGAWK